MQIPCLIQSSILTTYVWILSNDLDFSRPNFVTRIAKCFLIRELQMRKLFHWHYVFTQIWYLEQEPKWALTNMLPVVTKLSAVTKFGDFFRPVLESLFTFTIQHTVQFLNPLSLLWRKWIEQGVTKRCRLSWLTNSALVCVPKCGGWGLQVLSQWEQLWTWSPNKLWRSNPIFTVTYGIESQLHICNRAKFAKNGCIEA